MECFIPLPLITQNAATLNIFRLKKTEEQTLNDTKPFSTMGTNHCEGWFEANKQNNHRQLNARRAPLHATLHARCTAHGERETGPHKTSHTLLCFRLQRAFVLFTRRELRGYCCHPSHTRSKYKSYIC